MNHVFLPIWTIPAPGFIGLLLLVVLGAAVYDVRYRRIPNWLTAGGVLAGLFANIICGGWSGVRLSLAGMVVGFAVYVLLYAIHAMGAGDVKLMAAVGAIVGWQNWFGILVMTGMSGGIIALILIVQKRRVQRTLWNVAFILSQATRGRAAYLRREELDVRSPKALGLPHGAVIAVGTMFFLAATTHLVK